MTAEAPGFPRLWRVWLKAEKREGLPLEAISINLNLDQYFGEENDPMAKLTAFIGTEQAASQVEYTERFRAQIGINCPESGVRPAIAIKTEALPLIIFEESKDGEIKVRLDIEDFNDPNWERVGIKAADFFGTLTQEDFSFIAQTLTQRLSVAVSLGRFARLPRPFFK